MMWTALVCSATCAALFGAVAVYFFLRSRQLSLDVSAESERLIGLNQDIAASEADVAARQGEIDRLTRELDAAREKAGEFQSANQACEVAIRALEAKEKALLALERKPLRLRIHTIFLDGVTQGGKSTFLRRVVDPTVTEEELASRAPTIDAVTAEMIPISFEDAPGHVLLHCIQFRDVPGEKLYEFHNTLEDYEDNRVSWNLATNITTEIGNAVALVVWDLTAPDVEQVQKCMNRSRISQAYGTKLAMRVIKGTAVFLNKVDLARKRAVDGERTAVEHAREVVTGEFEIVERLNGDIPFAVGSALTGEGVHACMGVLLAALDLGTRGSSAEVHTFRVEPTRGAVTRTIPGR